eukprot:15343589-Ditylum_brightwellii.AAC.1
MAPQHKLFLGRNAKISVMARFVHPSAHIRMKFSNMDKNQRLDDCTVLRWEEKFVPRKSSFAFVCAETWLQYMPPHVNAVHEQGYDLPEDIKELWNETGLVIDDDDNEPAPENVP